jgi:queuine tRNA-ribosyltransferase
MKTVWPNGFQFEVLHQSKRSKARLGRLTTPHGVIDTPAFVGVGTNGSLKAVSNVNTLKAGLSLMFCNTYHLMLHPGAELIHQMGGLHRYISFDAPLITDSGGFQVFSLAYGSVHQELKSSGKKSETSWVLSLNEEGVSFRSYRDGAIVHLTPESSVIAQQLMGSDIIIPLDELPPYHMGPEALKASFERTHRWMKRSLVQHQKHQYPQIMYGVVHGGLDPDLRRESIRILDHEGFEGLALGGSFGKTHHDLKNLLEVCTPHMPPLKPRHLLGIADPIGMEQAILAGIDTFDSAYPTKIARHGSLFTHEGMLKIRQKIYSTDPGPIDPRCPCSTCKNYSRAFLHHLYKVHEPVFMELSTIHNLEMILLKAKQYREAIARDEL